MIKFSILFNLFVIIINSFGKPIIFPSWTKPKRMSTIHPQMMERNHLLSQAVQLLLTTTLTHSLDLFNNWSQASFQISDIKGLTFVHHRLTYDIFIFLSCLTWKKTVSFHVFLECISTSPLQWGMSPCPQQRKFFFFIL